MPLHIPLLCQSRHHVEHKRHCGIGMGYYDYEDEDAMQNKKKSNGHMSRKKSNHGNSTNHDSSSEEDKSPSHASSNEFHSSHKNVHGFRPSISFIREARAAKPPKQPNPHQRHHKHPSSRHSIEVLARLAKDQNMRMSVDRSARPSRYSVDNACVARHASRPSSTASPTTASVKVKQQHGQQKHSKLHRSSQPTARNDSYTQFLVGKTLNIPQV